MWRGERSSWRCTNNGGCRGITSVHRGITKVHSGITKVHRGITKVHSGAARCRRRRVVNPIHAAFIKGLGDITPSQDHTPSLACKIIVETTGGSTEVSIRGQEPPQCGSHGVAQALMTVGGDLASQCKARGRIQRLRDGVNELLHRDEVLSLAIPEVLQMNTGEGVGVLLRTKTLVKGQREGVSPRHGIRERLRGRGWRRAFYSAGLWVQPCRAPRLETCPCIIIGSRGSGRWRFRGAGSRISIGCGRSAGQPLACGRRNSGRGGL